MVERTVKITNQIGLHARPATLVVNKAKTFSSSIIFIKEGKVYNGKSMLSILSMAAKQGDEVMLQAEGEDQDAAVAELCRLIESGLGEK